MSFLGVRTLSPRYKSVASSLHSRLSLSHPTSTIPNPPTHHTHTHLPPFSTPLLPSFAAAFHTSRPSAFALPQQHQAILRSTILAHTRPNGAQRRGFMSLFSSFFSDIDALAKRAKENPNDAAANTAYLEELARFDPAQVVSTYERRNFPKNDQATRLYLTALTQLGKLDRTHLRDVLPGLGELNQPHHNLAQPSPTTSGAMSLSVHKPLEVLVSERRSIGNFLFWLFQQCLFFYGFFCVYLAIQNSDSFSGDNKEVSPSTEERRTFDDVKGCDEGKAELEEVVAFLKNPKQFNRLGGRMPKGYLLSGPPGTGKTLLARAVAGEANVPFFYASGSEFEEMFVGVGARRLRLLFAAARKKAPCVLFIDEIDAVAAKRTHSMNRNTSMTINQLLTELDGFNPSDGVVVIAATNLVEVLDKAVTRPGRFDRAIHIGLPDVKGRLEILKVHSKHLKLEKESDLDYIARGTPGMSGAELANLLNMAAVKAASDGAKFISIAHLDDARDRVLMGSERKSHAMTPETKKLVAFHEAGHALVSLHTEGALPIYKATIVPRGQAEGMVQYLPEDDSMMYSRQQLLARMDVAMGGRVAEELIFGHSNVTIGAGSDLDSATNVARSMVTRCGMSDKVGLITLNGDPRDPPSQETQHLIEQEIQSYTKAAYERAKHILTVHNDQLHRLAEALMKYETLTKDQVKQAVAGVPIIGV